MKIQQNYATPKINKKSHFNFKIPPPNKIHFTGRIIDVGKVEKIFTSIFTSKSLFGFTNFLDKIESKVNVIMYSRTKKSINPDVKAIETQIKKQYGITAHFKDNLNLANIVSTVLDARKKLDVKAFPAKIIVNSNYFEHYKSFKDAQIILDKRGLLILSDCIYSKEEAMRAVAREIGEFAFAKSRPEQYKKEMHRQFVDAIRRGDGEDEQELKFFLDYFNGVQQSERTEPNLRLIKDVFAKKVMDIINASSIDKHTG